MYVMQHLVTLIGGKLHETLVRDTGQNGTTERRDESAGVFVYGDEVGGRKLLHHLIGLRVKIQHNWKTSLLGRSIRQDIRGVVARNFDIANATRCRAVEVLRRINLSQIIAFNSCIRMISIYVQ